MQTNFSPALTVLLIAALSLGEFTKISIQKSPALHELRCLNYRIQTRLDRKCRGLLPYTLLFEVA